MRLNLSHLGICSGAISGAISTTPIATWDMSSLALPSFLALSAAGSRGYFDATGTYQTAATNVARFDYDESSLALKGLLVESTKTNSLKYSQDFSNANWGVYNTAAAKLGAAPVAAPDGTMTAYEIQPGSKGGATIDGGASSYIYQGDGTFADTTAHTFSLWIRSVSGTVSARLGLNSSSTVFGDSGNLTITAAWTRFKASIVASGAFTGSVVIAPDVAGDVVQIYVWGAQLEAASFPSSYIATTSAGVSRADDLLSAALYASNPAIIQYRDLATGTRARKVINPWSGVSSESDEWIEGAAIYNVGVSNAYLSTKLTVDGPY